MNFNPHFDPKSIKQLSKILGLEIFDVDLIFIKSGVYYMTASGPECAQTPKIAFISGYKSNNDSIIAYLNKELITVLRKDVTLLITANGRPVPMGCVDLCAASKRWRFV